MFNIANPEEIKRAKVSDVYFERTTQILQKLRKNPWVRAEIRATEFPSRYNFAVLAGLDEAVQLLQGIPVELETLPEGSLFYPEEPVLTLSGRYIDFAAYETPLLGLICQASGVATKAARCRIAAGERLILSFGARRMHPTIAPMIERSAYIGGCDGVSTIKSAEVLKIEPSGTMPHSLVLILGDTVKATQAFNRFIDKKIKRISLIDTLSDEKFEAIRIAQGVPELYGIRFDTPKTRKGDFLGLLEEVRWELDIRGFKDVKIFVSGGIDEYEILKLNQIADAYGVGTSLSNAPVINFSLDIVEIEGKPIAKRGKKSGAKRVYICQKCGKRKTMLASKRQDCECGGEVLSLSKVMLKEGELITEAPAPSKIRNYLLEQLKQMELE